MRTRACGFTLIELLVALSIAALVIAAATAAVSSALAATSRSQGYAEALVIARSRLAEAEVVPAIEGESGGSEEVQGRRYDWRLVLAPFEMDEGEAGDTSEAQTHRALLTARIEVAWGEAGARRTVSATTLLLATPGARR